MGSKDIISKDIIKTIAKDIGRLILKLDIKDDIQLIEKEFTRIEKRDADIVFKNGDEIIHLEIQNNNHPKMHLRMIRYYTDLLFVDELFPVKQFVLYIGKDKCTMKNKIKRDKIDYSYDIIDIQSISCDKFLKSDDASAVALSILCDFGDKDKQEVVNKILKKLLELSNDEKSFRKYLKMVEILSSNRDLEKHVEKGEKMLTVDVEKLPSYNIGLQDGLQKGLQKATLQNAIIMIKKFKLSVDSVAKELNLKKEEILDYLKKEKDRD